LFAKVFKAALSSISAVLSKNLFLYSPNAVVFNLLKSSTISSDIGTNGPSLNHKSLARIAACLVFSLKVSSSIISRSDSFIIILFVFGSINEGTLQDGGLISIHQKVSSAASSIVALGILVSHLVYLEKSCIMFFAGAFINDESQLNGKENNIFQAIVYSVSGSHIPP
jgi:hypothetical protein